MLPRWNTAGNQSFDRSLAKLYREFDGEEEPVDESKLTALKEPFQADWIEWRIAQAGKGKDGKVWAKVLAYCTARAIQERLDAVCGPENWWNEFKAGPGGGVLCGITILVGDRPITKWDGADNSDIEAVKGGLSDATKRAAVQWGIGRYLYDLEEGWAEVVEKKTAASRWANCKVKVDGKEEFASFHWIPPKLPDWALPKRTPTPPKQEHTPEPIAPRHVAPTKPVEPATTLTGDAAYAMALAEYPACKYPTDLASCDANVVRHKGLLTAEQLATLRVAANEARERILTKGVTP